jgi:hypothetical protein
VNAPFSPRKIVSSGIVIAVMCRNIKTLHNFAPPATDAEIRASALQFVRKLSGFTKPSQANETAFGGQGPGQVACALRPCNRGKVSRFIPSDMRCKSVA